MFLHPYTDVLEGYSLMLSLISTLVITLPHLKLGDVDAASTLASTFMILQNGAQHFGNTKL